MIRPSGAATACDNLPPTQVAAAFPLRERGRAMAIFSGVSGGLTAIGPIAGGYLTQWTWRSIFWINVPVAIVALLLIRRSCVETPTRPEKLDYRGAALITGAMCLIVLGLQQSSVWGWGSIATWACVVAGALLMFAFVIAERRTTQPLLRLQIFRDRGFSVETLVLGLMSTVFLPFFFFASVYAQVSLAKSASNAGLYIMWFFLGFVIMAQVGGRILDKRGAKLAVVSGSALSAVGRLRARAASRGRACGSDRLRALHPDDLPDHGRADGGDVRDRGPWTPMWAGASG